MKRQPFFIILIALFSMGFSLQCDGQVGVNNTSSSPDPSAMMDIESTTRGVLIPRMTEIERDNISNPSHSLLVYQTNGDKGFYYNSGSPISPIWIPLASTTLNGPIRIPIDTLPFAINNPGSYYLTKTLNTSPGMNGITISSSYVNLDLNGNGLLGDGTGTSSAIRSVGSINHISIYNGFIANWGGYGINLSTSKSSSIGHIKVDGSGYSGLNLGFESTVYNCIATNNGLDGISVNNSSTVTNCSTLDNGADGIDVASYCSINNCHSKSNQGNGLETGATCQVIGCISYDNDDNGVYLGAGSTAMGNIASGNTLSGFELLTGSKSDNNQARSNSGNGFSISNDVSVTNCSADNNTLSGFLCSGGDARIDNNQSTDNGQHGINVTGLGNIIIRNTCSGNLSLSFNIVAGNMAGTMLTSASLNSNSNPYANIEF